jgi:phage terminase large subunit-like protein
MQERQEQEQRQRRNMERNQRGDAGDEEEDEEDGSAGSIGGEDDDNFYKDDGDDDYAPWDDKPAARNEPAHTRTHRVVQQRIVPAQAGDSFGV